jgi:hypothetical protein
MSVVEEDDLAMVEVGKMEVKEVYACTPAE